MAPIIQLTGITKFYRNLRALDNVSLEFLPGVTGLLGPNGAGKSTLIKVILGLVKVQRGEGEVLGLRLRTQAKKIRARIGFMPEDDCYLAGLSGVEMVCLAAQLSGLPGVEALRRSHEILDFAGIEQERYRPADTYSTGMRQKLKFAQAIVHDPQLLILDEPTSGLDPEERSAMLNRIRSLSKRAGKSVIISTHILPDVQAVCDQVVIVAGGKLRLSERLDVLSRPTTPTIRLRIAGASLPLIERAKREGIAISRLEQDELAIQETDGSVQRRILAWAAEIGLGVRSLTPAKNSLEQVFLDAVRETVRADS